MRPALPLALALLLAPVASAAWDQMGGDAAHSGRATVERLDVVGHPALTQGGASLSGLLDTGHGLLGLGRDDIACFLVRIEPFPSGVPETASRTFTCPQGARLVAWDAADQLAILCVDGSALSPLLQAWRIGGQQPAWTASPRQEVPDAASLLTGQVDQVGPWSCSGAALAGGRLYVPFSSSSTGRNRIEARAASDGSLAWSTPVPSSLFLQQANASLVPGPVQDASGAFRAEALVATRTGIVVSGRLDGTGVAGAPPGLAWLSLDGKLQGALTRQPDAQSAAGTGGTLFPSSQGPAANGALAAQLLGDSLFVVDPAHPQGTLTKLGNPSLGQATLAAPCWSRDTLFVPGEAAAFILAATDPSQARAWPGLGGGRLQSCLASDQGLAWAAVSSSANGTAADAVLVDLASARSLLRLPLGLRPRDASALTVHLLPLAGGQVLAWEDGGSGALLGHATAPAPRLFAADAYPAVNSAARVTAFAPAGAANATLLLAWGDGFLEEVQKGQELSHVYAAAGDRTVTLTAMDADGLTSSAAQVLRVGTPAPPPRGLLDILFAPDKQNYTFFGIGLLLTGLGSAYAAVNLHRGRHRLERLMAALDRIRDGGRRDPFKAVRELHAYREERRVDLAKGRLEDAQYTVIEANANLVLELLRQRILGTFVGRLSDRFTSRLDLALMDGAIDAAEDGALLSAVADEPHLTAAEKERLRGLVQSWQRVIR
ncbi:MAG TPA: PKD domain-containing protein [Candidatus Thermoplasmatota archaeon]|nr:PKD domain-containing protein [Candidatus Thermoplasmatota archaeon]